MTCIRILKPTVIPAFNSKPERIEGSQTFQVDLGKLKFPTSDIQCTIVHKAFTLGHFRFSFTSDKQRRRRMRSSNKK